VKDELKLEPKPETVQRARFIDFNHALNLPLAALDSRAIASKSQCFWQRIFSRISLFQPA
jgi:hypothetical protein